MNDLIDELEATANWLEERAGRLQELAAGSRATIRSQLLEEIAKLRGRAAVIRVVAFKAKGGAA